MVIKKCRRITDQVEAVALRTVVHDLVLEAVHGRNPVLVPEAGPDQEAGKSCTGGHLHKSFTNF